MENFARSCRLADGHRKIDGICARWSRKVPNETTPRRNLPVASKTERLLFRPCTYQGKSRLMPLLAAAGFNVCEFILRPEQPMVRPVELRTTSRAGVEITTRLRGLRGGNLNWQKNSVSGTSRCEGRAVRLSYRENKADPGPEGMRCAAKKESASLPLESYRFGICGRCYQDSLKPAKRTDSKRRGRTDNRKEILSGRVRVSAMLSLV